jgi:hypothetical protein
MNIQFTPGQGVLGAPSQMSLIGGNQGISDAFRSELTSVLESTLERFGINASNITISVDQPSATGQARQNLVATANAPASITGPAPSPTPFVETTEPSTSKSASSTSPAATPDSPQYDAAYDDAYWNAQPAAVQQLRDIGDPDKRGALASQLAAAGYKIDVPIMMWGWDPSKTMAMRESFGYTWVPSAYQAPVQVAPGVSFPPLAPYDPKNPPPGSIQVA